MTDAERLNDEATKRDLRRKVRQNRRLLEKLRRLRAEAEQLRSERDALGSALCAEEDRAAQAGERARALVEKWRAAMRGNEWSSAADNTLAQCAAELEAVLTTGAPVPEPPA